MSAKTLDYLCFMEIIKIKNKMRKYLILTGVVLCLAGCGGAGREDKATKSVKVDTVRVYGRAGSATFPGKVMASSDVSLAFRISGPILSVNVNVGSYVRKGQVLAQIDPRDYRVQLAATEAEYNRIKSEADRVKELFEKESVAPNDYDKALYGYKQISAKYEAHKNALADTRLLAPCNGYVHKRLFEPGETVGAGTPVISMISTGTGEVEINIPSSDYIRRDEFDSYHCTADVYPGQTFPLELIGITRKANLNQLYVARFRFAGGGGEIPGPGMSTMVTIKYKTDGAQAVSLPLSSVLESDSGPAVWVYDPASETISARPVTISQIHTDGTVVASSGLSAGEIVVSAGIHSVKDGERVRLLPPASPTNVGGML